MPTADKPDKPKKLPQRQRPYRAPLIKTPEGTMVAHVSPKCQVAIDHDMVIRMAEADCSLNEMAAILGVAPSTLDERIHRVPELRAAIEASRAKLRNRLRLKQIELADEKNIAMLIWLGKQMLGQRDSRDYRHSGDADNPIAIRAVEMSDDDLRRGIAEDSARLAELTEGEHE